MRFVSAYRPVRNRQDSGSTWNQHSRYLRSTHRLDDPIECFDKDLCEQLEQWLALGDHLILGMDMNEETRTSTLNSSLQRIGLQNRVLTEHPNLVPPSTFQHNTNSQPIDAIWTTPLVQVRQTGILSFDHTILAHHRCLRMDVDIDIFGIQPPDSLAKKWWQSNYNTSPLPTTALLYQPFILRYKDQLLPTVDTTQLYYYI